VELEEVTPASQSEKLPPGEQQAMWHGLFDASFGEATSATKKGPWNELETGTQCMYTGCREQEKPSALLHVPRGRSSGNVPTSYVLYHSGFWLHILSMPTLAPLLTLPRSPFHGSYWARRRVRERWRRADGDARPLREGRASAVRGRRGRLGPVKRVLYRPRTCLGRRYTHQERV
jgi:hypothetical protein